jgi:hypothetical protein
MPGLTRLLRLTRHYDPAGIDFELRPLQLYATGGKYGI